MRLHASTSCAHSTSCISKVADNVGKQRCTVAPRRSSALHRKLGSTVPACENLDDWHAARAVQLGRWLVRLAQARRRRGAAATRRPGSPRRGSGPHLRRATRLCMTPARASASGPAATSSRSRRPAHLCTSARDTSTNCENPKTAGDAWSHFRGPVTQIRTWTQIEHQLRIPGLPQY